MGGNILGLVWMVVGAIQGGENKAAMGQMKGQKDSEAASWDRAFQAQFAAGEEIKRNTATVKANTPGVTV